MKKIPAKQRFSTVNGWFVRSIGYKISRAGRKTAAAHYLSKVLDDPKGIQADEKAAALTAQWQRGEGCRQIDHAGGSIKVWASTDERPTTPVIVAATPSAVQQAAPPLNLQVNTSATVDAMIVAYLAAQLAGGKSHGHYVTTKHRLAYVADQVVNGNRIGSLPMSRFDEGTLLATVEQVANRPIKSNGNPYSLSHCGASLKWMRYALEWADDTDRWTTPRRFAKIFRENKPRQVATERDALLDLRANNGDDGKYFPVDELALIYGAMSVTDPFARLCLCLSLNCGFGSGELNTLRRKEIVGLDTANPYIHRFRAKTTKGGQSTGVYAKWGYLFPETVELLKRYIAANNVGPEDYVLRTEEGDRVIKELFDHNGKPRGRYDYWYKVFVWAKKIAKKQDKPRDLSPKYLRKTGGRMIRHKSGDALATMYLSHGDTGGGDKILEAYSERDWDNLIPALKDLHQQLKPMFAAKAVAKIVSADQRAQVIARMKKAREAKKAKAA